jgi:hypothetical protein
LFAGRLIGHAKKIIRDLHVIGERGEERLEPFIRGSIGQVASKDLMKRHASVFGMYLYTTATNLLP